MKNLLLCVVMVFAGLLAGCSGGSSAPAKAPAPNLTSIAVTPVTPMVAAGLTQQFKATGTYSDNSTQDLTATAVWTSSNTGSATITSPGGLATTSHQGSTLIMATVGSISGSTTLTVTAAVLDSIAVTPANASVPLGTLTQFTAMGTYSDGSTQNLTSTVTWSSSNTTTATITAAGVVTALTLNGTTTITATSGTVSGSTGLTVVPATLTSIVISGAPTVTIANGTSYQFTAFGFYNDGSKHNLTLLVTWASSNTAIATIATGPGRAQAVGMGTTTISATLGSVSGMATLNVTAPTLQSIVVGASSTTIAPLTARSFTAIGTFSDSSTQNITQDVVWSSSNTALATISNASGTVGVATGVAPGGGTATISATYGGVNGSAPLNVSSATLTSIAVAPATAGLAQGSTLALQAVGTFSDGTTQHIETVATWTSSNTSVASVAQNIVTGVSDGGPVTITCSLNGVSGTASLTVEGLTAITITPASGSVAENTSIGLVATGTLADGTTQNITGSVLWTSSNPAVATMSDASGSFGQATGVAPGTVTVIAVFAGQVGVASLTVTDATLSSITIKPASADIALGSPQGFSATGKFSDGTTQDLGSQVTWSSSDITVAFINNTGAISTTGTGTTTIEAALGTINDTAVLTVH